MFSGCKTSVTEYIIIKGFYIQFQRILNAIQEGTAYGEENALGIRLHEDGGSAAFAPAVAAYRLVNKILKGFRGDEDTYDCAFVKQEGHLKKFLPYMTSIVKFGKL